MLTGRSVHVVDVGRVVTAVMNFHRHRVDVRLVLVRGVGKRIELERPGGSLRVRARHEGARAGGHEAQQERAAIESSHNIVLLKRPVRPLMP